MYSALIGGNQKSRRFSNQLREVAFVEIPLFTRFFLYPRRLLGISEASTVGCFGTLEVLGSKSGLGLTPTYTPYIGR